MINTRWRRVFEYDNGSKTKVDIISNVEKSIEFQEYDNKGFIYNPKKHQWRNDIEGYTVTYTDLGDF